MQCTQGSKSSCMRVEWFITYIYLYLPVYLPIYSVRVSLLTCLLRVFAPVNNSAIQYLKAVVLIHFVLNTLNMLNTAQIQFSCSLIRLHQAVLHLYRSSGRARQSVCGLCRQEELSPGTSALLCVYPSSAGPRITMDPGLFLSLRCVAWPICWSQPCSLNMG